MYISPIWGAKTPGQIKPNFLVVGVHDVITPFKIGDDQFRGFVLAEGQSLHFPTDFEGRPYNTHTIVRCDVHYSDANTCCRNDAAR